MDYKKITNATFESVDEYDYPDFSDAYIFSADYDGVEMTEAQLDEINEDSGFVHERLIESLY